MFSKKLLLASFAFLLFFASCRKYSPTDPMLKTNSQAALREDLFTLYTILTDSHPSLFRYTPAKKWNELYKSIYGSLKDGISTRDFYNKLSELISAIRCSHTELSLPDIVVDSLAKRKYFFPVPVLLIGNKVLVNSDNLLPHGTRIISVNHRLID